MSRAKQLKRYLDNTYKNLFDESLLHANQVTLECSANNLLALCKACKEDENLLFDQLVDVCGVDYLEYGLSEWATESTTATGFSRGVDGQQEKHQVNKWDKPRFAAVYHFCSIALNQRLRIRVLFDEDKMRVPSLVELYPAANWFEREAFDLFGIIFDGHPDLRRILTDYGFVGHPFRKDFPISGEVEVRYDAKQQRVIYEPVDIEPRILVPKVIRDDSRYLSTKLEGEQND